MGLFFVTIKSKPGESMLWQGRGTWQQRGVARGGTIAITSQALMFAPNHAERLLGAKPRRVELEDILAVGIDPAGSNWQPPFGGGLRARLRVSSRHGGVEMVMVPEVETRLALVESAMRGRRGCSETAP